MHEKIPEKKYWSNKIKNSKFKQTAFEGLTLPKPNSFCFEALGNLNGVLGSVPCDLCVGLGTI